MTKHVAIVWVLLAMCFSGSAVAAESTNFYDGNEVAEYCEAYAKRVPPDRIAQANFCAGYVGGAVDALRDSRLFCVPHYSVQTNQLVDLVKNYFRDHPELRHNPAADLISVAIAAKFPCN